MELAAAMRSNGAWLEASCQPENISFPATVIGISTVSVLSRMEKECPIIYAEIHSIGSEAVSGGSPPPYTPCPLLGIRDDVTRSPGLIPRSAPSRARSKVTNSADRP